MRSNEQAVFNLIKSMAFDARGRIVSSLDNSGRYSWATPYPYFYYPETMRDSKHEALSNETRRHIMPLLDALNSEGCISGGVSAGYLSVVKMGIGECGESINTFLAAALEEHLTLSSAGEIVIFGFHNPSTTDNHVFALFFPHDILAKLPFMQSEEQFTVDDIVSMIPTEAENRAIIIDPWRYFVEFYTKSTKQALLSAANQFGINILMGKQLFYDNKSATQIADDIRESKELVDIVYKSFQERHWSLFSLHRRVETKHNTLVALLNQTFPTLCFEMLVNDRTFIVDAVVRLNEENIKIAEDIEKKYQIGSIVVDRATKQQYLVLTAINDNPELGKKIQELCNNMRSLKENISLSM